MSDTSSTIHNFCLIFKGADGRIHGRLLTKDGLEEQIATKDQGAEVHEPLQDPHSYIVVSLVDHDGGVDGAFLGSYKLKTMSDPTLSVEAILNTFSPGSTDALYKDLLRRYRAGETKADSQDIVVLLPDGKIETMQ